MNRAALAMALAAVAALAMRAVLWSSTRTPPPAEELPRSSTAQGYVSSDACAACHPAQYQSWYRSIIAA